MSEYPIIMFLKQDHHIRHTRAHKEDTAGSLAGVLPQAKSGLYAG